MTLIGSKLSSFTYINIFFQLENISQTISYQFSKIIFINLTAVLGIIHGTQHRIENTLRLAFNSFHANFNI